MAISHTWSIQPFDEHAKSVPGTHLCTCLLDKCSQGNIIMGGNTLPDADPHVMIVWVFPFSAPAMEYTAFRPTCVTTPVGFVTTVIPVSSTL